MLSRADLYTLSGLCILILAFFPGFFHTLWTTPFTLVSRHVFSSQLAHSSSASNLQAQTCLCSAPIFSTAAPSTSMSWFQKTFSLTPRSRGSYLVTDQITKALPEIKDYKVGILHLFIQHTSCAIGLNENWDEEVRADMSDALDRIVPMDKSGEMYRHNAEGPDDMPVSYLVWRHQGCRERGW